MNRKYIATVLVTAVAVLIALAGPLGAQTTPPSKAGVINSAHDPAGEGCQTCHAPHNAQVTTTNQQSLLLWSKGFSAQTFGTYESPTMDSPTAEVGGTQPANTEARMYSYLCMSCHDGVTTPTLIGSSAGSAIGNPTTHFGLKNDHPINMPYDESKDKGLAPKSALTTSQLVLYGTTNTVQCASCHNVHSDANGHFLRKTNANSGLCLSCHL